MFRKGSVGRAGAGARGLEAGPEPVLPNSDGPNCCTNVAAQPENPSLCQAIIASTLFVGFASPQDLKSFEPRLKKEVIDIYVGNGVQYSQDMVWKLPPMNSWATREG